MSKPTPSSQSYIFVRYASDANGTDFSDTPDVTRKYIGFLAKNSPTPPTQEEYAGKWQKYIGEVDKRELSEKRNKTDLNVVIPKYDSWTWTTVDERCPADFLRLANSIEAPRPRFTVDSNGVGHWVGVNFYNDDGSLKYECYITSGGSATDTTVRFRFRIMAEAYSTFLAVATRPAVDDPTATAATTLLTGIKLKDLVRDATSFEDFKNKITSEL